MVRVSVTLRESVVSLNCIEFALSRMPGCIVINFVDKRCLPSNSLFYPVIAYVIAVGVMRSFCVCIRRCQRKIEVELIPPQMAYQGGECHHGGIIGRYHSELTIFSLG